MIQTLRSFFASKMGVAIALGFLGLISLAFLGSGVATDFSFGGSIGGNRLATVGGERVDPVEVDQASRKQVEQLRAEYPTLNMKTFVSEGGFDKVLDDLIDMAALREFAARHGINIGKRLIDSEIAKIPSVQGADGRFNQASYQYFLSQQGLSDQELRNRIAAGLLQRQILSGTQFGIAVPHSVVVRYAGVLTEKRSGTVVLLPSAGFAAAAAPSESEIQAWYKAHSADYMRPERRVVRYAVFNDSVLKAVPAPTEAELAARYEANKARYAASESRKITQVVIASEADAKALAAEVAGGKSLDAAAKARGLTPGSLGSLSKEALSGQTTSAIADAVFAAPGGKLVGPLKGPLGWLVLRVDSIERKESKSFEQARAELTDALIVDKRRAALTDFSAQIEDEFANGATLSEVAEKLGLKVESTPQLLADGSVFGQQGARAPEAIGKLLPTAFLMEAENQPQLAEVEPGKTFMLFDVGSIEAAAPAPLDQIRAQVAEDVRLASGAKAAGAAAKKLEAMIAKGADPAVAMRQLGNTSPMIDRIVDRPRQEVQAMGKNVPAPILLLFSMAKGKTRVLAAPRNRGWYVVTVSAITPGQVDEKDPRLADLGKRMAQSYGQDYTEQMRLALREEVGVKRNETTIKALREQLSGGN